MKRILLLLIGLVPIAMGCISYGADTTKPRHMVPKNTNTIQTTISF